MGIFSIFKKKEHALQVPVDLSLIGTDMHSHLVPGIDDGAKTVSDSLDLIRSLHALGFRKLITTPHIMGDFYRNTPATILSGLGVIQEELLRTGEDHPSMSAAAEYYCDYDLEKKLDNEELLTFGNRYLLFEISYLNPPDNLYHIIFKMQTQGYKPVLAHPERYNFWHREFEKFEEIADKGVLLQLNINSLTGYYSESTKMVARRMIDKNMISFAGTDCHHAGHINLLKQAVYDPHLQKLVESGRLLNSTL